MFTNYTLDFVRPNPNRNVAVNSEIPRTYEQCEDAYSKEIPMPFSLLHYAFMFRRFDIVDKILNDLSETELREAMQWSGSEQFEWITPIVCAKWNLNYLRAYDDKNLTDIYGKLSDLLDKVNNIDELMEYTDIVDVENHKNIFDIFWNGNQPMLDVIYYEKQELASKQVEKNGFSIVMDEVGTGKTVSALYEIRNIIQRCIDEDKNKKARILIVCPHNKREDWQSDIRRQLGRYAHIVEQSDDGNMYEGNLKKVFFKKDEHQIFVTGQKQGEDKNGSDSALKGSLEHYSDTDSWDLVVIDEAHISFDNYFGIRAERAMLLTATPIVVNAKEKRRFEDYLRLGLGIISKSEVLEPKIDPINKAEPDEGNVYVNWFREDMGKQSAERNIIFVPCKRWEKRNEVFDMIKRKTDILTALQYDQDDDYLYEAIKDNIDDDAPKENGKIEELKKLLKDDELSYIVFCEHKYVVHRIFDVIKDEFTECIVAEKCGAQENQYGLENVQPGQLINTLMQALRSGKRTIFITTGKTGGTGLNLGEFDGVIHYELPFTSIELEQRFGRIDRIDTMKEDKVRNMIFLLNECEKGENDMEINRMLYYCTTKIDITCQSMPIRNTVLYHPEFIMRNGEAIRDFLECFKKKDVLSKENEKRMKEWREKIKQGEKEIKDDDCWEYVEKPEGNSFKKIVNKALSQERDNRISEEYYILMSNYLKDLDEYEKKGTDYQKNYRIFLKVKKIANDWLSIVDGIIDKESDVFEARKEQDDNGEEQDESLNENSGRPVNSKLSDDEEEQDVDAPDATPSIQKQIEDLIKPIDKCIKKCVSNKLSFSSKGIFYYKDEDGKGEGRIYRSTVEDYRKGNALKTGETAAIEEEMEK